MRGIYGFVEKQLNLYKKFWLWEITWMIYSVVTTLSIGLIGAGMNEIAGGTIDTQEITLYLLVGSIVWSYLALVFWEISHTITWERWEGTLEYTFMAPVSRASHLFGTSIFAIVYSLIRAAAVFVVAVWFFGLDLSGLNLFGAMLILALSSVAFIGLGMIAAVFPLLSPEKGPQFNHIIEASLMMVSGVFYPITVLPGWMQKLSVFSPARYTIEGMRKALLENVGTGELVQYFTPLIILGALLVPLGIFTFSLVEEHAKKTGKLRRTG